MKPYTLTEIWPYVTAYRQDGTIRLIELSKRQRGPGRWAKIDWPQIKKVNNLRNASISSLALDWRSANSHGELGWELGWLLKCDQYRTSEILCGRWFISEPERSNWKFLNFLNSESALTARGQELISYYLNYDLNNAINFYTDLVHFWLYLEKKNFKNEPCFSKTVSWVNRSSWPLILNRVPSMIAQELAQVLRERSRPS
jgi:hypothetical protein